MESQGWLISQDLNTNDKVQSTGSADKLITKSNDDNSKVDSPRMRSTPLRLALPSDDTRGQYLSATRREMYDALALFHAHVKSVVSLMFGIMTAVMAVVGIVLERNDSPKLISVVLHVAPAILALIFLFGLVSIVSIGRYYRLYVEALAFAVILHDQEGIDGHQT